MKIKCPACSKVLSIPESAAGKVVKCPCGKQLRAPAMKAGGAPAATKSAPRPAAPPAQRPAATRRPTAAPPANFDGGGFFDELTDEDLEPVKAVNKPGRAEARDRSAGAKALQQYAPSPGDGRRSGGGGQSLASMTLATPGERILAVLIDGLVYGAFAGIGGIALVLAVTFIAGAGDGESAASTKVLAGITILFYGFVISGYLFNAYLISRSGQTVGKKAMGIRIVNSQTGATASFSDGWLMRTFVFALISSIPAVGFVVGIMDLVYFFQEGHETLHDKLAKTIVVKNKR